MLASIDEPVDDQRMHVLSDDSIPDTETISRTPSQFARHDVSVKKKGRKGKRHISAKLIRVIAIVLAACLVVIGAFLLYDHVSSRYADSYDNVTLAAALTFDNDKLETLLGKNGYTNTGGGNWEKDDGASLAVGTGCYLLQDNFSGTSDESALSPDIAQVGQRDWATIHVSGYDDLEKALHSQGLKVQVSTSFFDVFGQGDCIVALCTCNKESYVVFGGFDGDDVALLACTSSSLAEAFTGVFSDDTQPYDGIVDSLSTVE